MKKIATVVCLICVVVMLAVLWQSVPSDARRFGGGRSFGSGSSFKFFNKKTSPSVGSSKTATSKAPMTSSRRGLGGGLLGGMLMGGLLGSMLMGGPFMGPNLFDLLIFGGIIFLLFKLFSRRRMAVQTARNQPGGPGAGTPDMTPDTEAFWNRLRSPEAAPTTQGADTSGPRPAGIGDFDEAEFLKGAKMMYQRLQKAWDARELEDIREFVSPGVYREIAAQAEEDPDPGNTEILLVNAKILEVKPEQGVEKASVLFDVLLREDQAGSQSNQIQEVWTFIRDRGSARAHWTLDGIQQVENTEGV